MSCTSSQWQHTLLGTFRAAASKDLAALICASILPRARAKCAATCDTAKTRYVKMLTSVQNWLRGSIQKMKLLWLNLILPF